MDDILNDVEKAAIQQFVQFDTMREAVKKVLLKAIYSDGVLTPGKPADPLQNLLLAYVSQHLTEPDEIIGANVRATYYGINALEIGFKKLAEFKKVEPEKPKVNKAR